MTILTFCEHNNITRIHNALMVHVSSKVLFVYNLKLGLLGNNEDREDEWNYYLHNHTIHMVKFI